jgi:hypothetical protein
VQPLIPHSQIFKERIVPNPTDPERGGDATMRSGRLLQSAGNAANAKKSWSEWFGAASNNWLGSTLTGHGADTASGAVSGAVQEGIAAHLAAVALGTTLAGISGFWVVGAVGMVAMEIVGKKLEDKAKEVVPQALSAAKAAVDRAYFGSGKPDIALNSNIKKDGKDQALEDTMERLKTNSALLQDLLNKIAGAAGKPYFCDDAYHIAVLAQKCATTKGELLFDIEVLGLFLNQLKTDLNKIDPVVINDKVKDLAKAICNVGDGRHWDNSWGAATVKRAFRCSREHCFGPK